MVLARVRWEDHGESMPNNTTRLCSSGFPINYKIPPSAELERDISEQMESLGGLWGLYSYLQWWVLFANWQLPIEASFLEKEGTNASPSSLLLGSVEIYTFRNTFYILVLSGFELNIFTDRVFTNSYYNCSSLHLIYNLWSFILRQSLSSSLLLDNATIWNL